jgi:hypothetical protein
MTDTTRVAHVRRTVELDLFGLYLDEVGRHPLLAADDEIELSQAYEAAWTPGVGWPLPPPTTRAAPSWRFWSSGASGPAAR